VLRFLFFFCLILASLWGPLSFNILHADEPSRAGLVILHDDGRVSSLCLGFEEEEISGADLLTLSELPVIIDASRGMGITICQIEGTGCAYPAEPCFCQCMGGGECGYWNYYYRDPGESDWSYSPLGALKRRVLPGAVEAWVWGDGQSPPSAELTFESICARPSTAASPTPLVVPTLVNPTAQAASASPAATVDLVHQKSAAEPTLAVERVPTDPPTPASSESSSALAATSQDTGVNLTSYWAFGVTILCLVVIGLLIGFRRR
jgi:hypothetical protein